MIKSMGPFVILLVWLISLTVLTSNSFRFVQTKNTTEQTKAAKNKMYIALGACFLSIGTYIALFYGIWH